MAAIATRNMCYYCKNQIFIGFHQTGRLGQLASASYRYMLLNKTYSCGINLLLSHLNLNQVY